MALIIKHRRGLAANLPATAEDGELLLSTDDGRLHRGTGTGVESIKVAMADVINLLGSGGRIKAEHIPALAITNVFVEADIAGRDALVVGSGEGEVGSGDVCVVLDADGQGHRDSFIWDGGAWQDLGDGNVTSVNGYAGDVVLDSDDIAEGATNLYYTDARVLAFLTANGYIKDGDNANRLGSGSEAANNLLEADGAGGTRWVSVLDLGAF